VVGSASRQGQPPPTPPQKGGESFSWFLGARQRTGMSDYFENETLDRKKQLAMSSRPNRQ